MSVERIRRIAALSEALEGADHVDVKSIEGRVSLKAFVADFLSYQPCWMRILWKIRGWLMAALGQGGQEVPEKASLTEGTLPVEPGNAATFFTVVDSDGETFWVAAAKDDHLEGVIGVVSEPVDSANTVTRFHVATIVHYGNWAGPVYFNLIRPFHHLVVAAAMRCAARPR